MQQGQALRLRHPALALALIGSAAFPATASAHGLIQRATLPIPETFFLVAAAVVLVVSFLALAVLWQQPRLTTSAWRPLPGGRVLGSPVLEAICGAIGVLLLALTIVAGFAGTENAFNNFATVFIFVVFWVGMALASMLLGDVFKAFNPWRALGRVLRLRGHHEYPERLGRWPAVVGLALFGWIELVSGWGEHPRAAAAAVLGYTIVTLAAQAYYGTAAWTARGEAFSVYFNLLSRLSVFERRERTVGVRKPLSALSALDQAPGTVALLMVAIGVITYDGLSGGTLWLDLTDRSTSKLVGTLGIVLAVAVVSVFYAVGAGSGDNRRAFVHSLVPIAMVYVAAHYIGYLLAEGQGMFYLVSDPLGKGWDLLGTASAGIEYEWLGQNAMWYLQVGFVVSGHVAGLLLAHDRALERYGDSRAAARSQLRMLIVMIGFTGLALGLLAAPQG